MSQDDSEAVTANEEPEMGSASELLSSLFGSVCPVTPQAIVEKVIAKCTMGELTNRCHTIQLLHLYLKRELNKELNLQEPIFDSISYITKTIENFGGNLSTCCGYLLYLAEIGTSQQIRHRMREFVCSYLSAPSKDLIVEDYARGTAILSSQIPPPRSIETVTWPTLFKGICIVLTKGDPYSGYNDTAKRWRTLKQTDEMTIEEYLATETDLWLSLTGYSAMLDTPLPNDRVHHLLRNLKTSLKTSLAKHFRDRALHTEGMSYEDIVRYIREVSSKLDITYSWDSRHEPMPPVPAKPVGAVQRQEKRKDTDRAVPKTKQARDTGPCSGCGHTGHTPDQCWTLHPHLRPQREAGNDSPCPGCGHKGHGVDQCWTLHPNLRPAKAATSTEVCPGCGHIGHGPEQCWTLHPELRPSKAAPTVGKPAESSGAPRTAPPYTKPVTRQDTRKAGTTSVTKGKTYTVQPVDISHDTLFEATVNFILTDSGKILTGYIDTLSHYTIISSKLLKKLNITPVEIPPIPVKGFGGTANLTSTALLPLRLPNTEDFQIFTYVSDVEYDLDGFILGLPTLKNFGVSLDLYEEKITFADLNTTLPLRYTTSTKSLALPHVAAILDAPSRAEADLDLLEENLMQMSDSQLRDFAAQRMIGYEPLKARSVLKQGEVVQQSRGYGVQVGEEQALCSLLDELTQAGVISETVPRSTDFISPAFLRSKKEVQPGVKRYRLLADLRALNKALLTTESDESVQDMREITSIQKDAMYFGTIDIKDAFFSVDIDEEANDGIRLHVIRIGQRFFTFHKCPQGEKNSPANWNRHLAHILRTGIGCLYRRWLTSFVDDMLVYGPTLLKCSTRFKYVLALLEITGKKVSKLIEPCEEVDICGLTLNKNGWRMSNASIASLLTVTQIIPNDLKTLRRGLGCLMYMRSGFGFPSQVNLSAELKQYYEMISIGNDKIQFTEQQAEHWRSIGETFQTRPLAFYDAITPLKENEVYICASDASDGAIGGSLHRYTLQPNENLTDMDCSVCSRACLIDVFSETLNKTQENWPIFEREAYGMYKALRRHLQLFNNTLGASGKIVAFLDNNCALAQWRTLQPPERLCSRKRWLRWYEDLSSIVDRILWLRVDGEVNNLADMLSRFSSPAEQQPVGRIYAIRLNSTEPAATMDISTSVIETLSRGDATTYGGVKLSDFLNTGVPPSLSHQFRIESNCIYYCNFSPNSDSDWDQGWCLYIPEGKSDESQDSTLRELILTRLHCIDHCGVATLVNKCYQHGFWWPNCRASAQQFVSTCNVCHLARAETCKRLEVVQRFKLPLRERTKHVSVDHVKTSCGNIILSVMCLYTAYTQFYLVPDETAEAAVLALMQWMMAFGTIRSVQSDNGPAFTSNLWRLSMAAMDIHRKYTANYNPQANGVERSHQMLRRLLRIRELRNEHELSNISIYLSLAALGWNSTARFGTSITPYSLLFGTPPTDTIFNKDEVINFDPIEIDQTIRNNISNIINDYDIILSSERQKQSIAINNQVNTDETPEVGMSCQFGIIRQVNINTCLVESLTGEKKVYRTDQLTLFQPGHNSDLRTYCYSLQDFVLIDGCYIGVITQMDDTTNKIKIRYYDVGVTKSVALPLWMSSQENDPHYVRSADCPVGYHESTEWVPSTRLTGPPFQLKDMKYIPSWVLQQQQQQQQ